MTRATEISTFLNKAGWPKAQRIPLAGDAGNRRYERLSDLNQGNAILMDAEPKLGEDIRSFLKISHHLLDCGISAPKIFNQNISLGLILMQDFGDELLYKAVNDTPHLELKLYRLAIDVLNQLHKSPPPKEVGSYFPPEMSKALVTALPWYCEKGLSREITEEAEISLSKLDWSNPVLVLRDFHAQNLIYRYEQSGLAQMGVLDFQDAQLGHPLYDVTSLIHDARRILNPSVVSLLLQELTKNYRGQDDFKYAFSTLSAQRNLRILGVFARLCLQDKKPSYLNLIPHVWNNLWKDLSHPLLTNLSKICESLPTPSPSFLEGLRKNG
ncbi:MAG: phosphotransferase [Planktomarina sp.]|nr:phosphotransferase [Planktomarina sp.]